MPRLTSASQLQQCGARAQLILHTWSHELTLTSWQNRSLSSCSIIYADESWQVPASVPAAAAQLLGNAVGKAGRTFHSASMPNTSSSADAYIAKDVLSN